MPPFQLPELPLQPSPMTEPARDPVAPPSEDPFEALLQRIRDFNDSANQLSTQQVMNQRISESEKVSTIIKAFEVLQSLGVNPSNPQSIAKYLMKLEEENPDMAEMAKKTLYGIFGGEPAANAEELPMPAAGFPQEEPQF